MDVLIDGAPVPPESASVSVFDLGLQRGFGCFEVVRSYDGVPFRVDDHLGRLFGGLECLGISGPARSSLREWVKRQAADGGDGFVRVIVTGGSGDGRIEGPSRCIVIWEPPHDLPSEFTLVSQRCGWIVPSAERGAVEAKTLSYALNVHATRRARRAGASDALLVSPDGSILEGPNFAVAWMRDGVLEMPSLDVGILGSITRSVVLDLGRAAGMSVVEGRFALETLALATEVMALSTVVEVWPVVGVDGKEYAPGPATARLAADFRKVVGGAQDGAPGP